MKHTKGEWEVDKDATHCNYDCVNSSMAYRVKTDDWDIAAVWKDADGDCEANANLIAAAPELLEALQDVLTVFEERETAIPVSTQIKIEQAIKKATS